MPLMPAAVGFAARAHRHQTRNDGMTPYISHVVRVTLILAVEFGITDDEVLAAALLHDTIEDCNVDYDDIHNQFGETVANWVACLTKDTRLPNDEREKTYLTALETGPWQVHAIKLADTLDNLRDSASLSAERRAKTRAKAVEVLGVVGMRAGERLAGAMRLVREAASEEKLA